jgi:hypothetical protein
MATGLWTPLISRTGGEIMGILPDVTSAIGVGGGLLSNIFGGIAQRRLQRKQWAREDSAVQRRARDLEAAGLSKTLAAGSAAESSQPIYASKGIEQLSGIPAQLSEAGQRYIDIQARKNQIAQTQAQTRISNAEARLKETEANIKEKEYEYLTTPYGQQRDMHGNLVTVTGRRTPLAQRFDFEDEARAWNHRILQMHTLMMENEEYRSKYERALIEQKEKYPGIGEGEAELRAARASMTLDELQAAREGMNQRFMEKAYEGTSGWIPPIVMDFIMQMARQFVPTAIMRYGGKGRSSGTYGNKRLPNPGEGFWWKKTPMGESK